MVFLGPFLSKIVLIFGVKKKYTKSLFFLINFILNLFHVTNLLYFLKTLL